MVVIERTYAVALNQCNHPYAFSVTFLSCELGHGTRFHVRAASAKVLICRQGQNLCNWDVIEIEGHRGGFGCFRGEPGYGCART
jgi:hypothetical protein